MTDPCTTTRQYPARPDCHRELVAPEKAGPGKVSRASLPAGSDSPHGSCTRHPANHDTAADHHPTPRECVDFRGAPRGTGVMVA